MQRIRIGELLIEQNYIDEKQLGVALDYQKQHPNMLLGEIFVELNMIDEEELLISLSKKLNLEYMKMRDIPVDTEVTKLIPQQIAEKYCLMATQRIDDSVVVVLNDPLNYYAIEDIKFFIPDKIKLVLCTKSSIIEAIEYYYSDVNAREAALDAGSVSYSPNMLAIDLDLDGDDQTPIIRLLNSLLEKGYNSNASDIHIEPYAGETLIRMRFNGIITDYLTIPANAHHSLVARIKILADMDIAEKRRPQDGHFKFSLAGKDINIRTSTVPTVFGEKVVMRFLNMNVAIDNASSFGMNEQNYNTMLNILSRPYGMVYFTGATGSGKSTTLYMILEHLAKQDVNIVTIEDPVERYIRKVSQMQVNVQAGLSFSSGLRALLRQDPDIVMVGETRDAETAEIAVRSAITGHIVLSTLHTNNAVSAITRLVDMGVEPYMVAGSMIGIVAQRLVRKVCPFCREEYAPTDVEKAILGEFDGILVRSTGCNHCQHTGYVGRVAIHEIVEVDSRVIKMIHDRTEVEKIQEYCVQERGMRTLATEMKELVRAGVTTFAEYMRMTHYIE